jgi:Isocitrate dehydrogenase kinase/phosphatase
VKTFGQAMLQQSHLQVANELFYRNKAAWLVGKLVTPAATLPFLVPIHRTDEGELFVDTCLTTATEASIVFGFARSYFMVYAPLPAAMVEWLREILPGKSTAELYMAIGCQKHAKTESYREYLHYIASTDEQFIEAPGIRGMVMLVFTLPGYDRVFKVIKDKFAPTKRDECRARSRLLSTG